MSRLAGKFAGIAVVSVAGDRLEALTADLEALAEQGLQVLVERTDDPGVRASVTLTLDLLGADHPGIVAEISASLAAPRHQHRGARTDVRDAPMSAAPSSRRTPSSPPLRRPPPTSCARCSRGSPTS